MSRHAPWIVVVFALVGPVGAQTPELPRPDWSRYHDSRAVADLLRRFAAAAPTLARVTSIGETRAGSPLLVLEITNRETGPGIEKPGYYYDGNIHSEELASGEVALHFAWYVLQRYGRDPRVTRLVDTRALYVRPKFNPDGADLALKTVHNPRSTPRPWDEDGDGRLDEDPPNDLDGDGFITQMRRPSSRGQWRISARDPRIMERRAGGGSGPFFDLLSEGIDDDGDGSFNEDDVGGIDMNRNFPRNWGLEFEQRGAGPFPLSEPETRATLDFLDAHRNVTGAFHGHTHGGFCYRLPSTTSWDDFDRADQRLITEIASGYERTTGQPVRPSYTDPRSHRHGTLISWLYWDFGVVGFVPEFWGGFGRDDDGDGVVSEIERLRWNDEDLGGEGFATWRPVQHPQLGEVEVGGWRRRFTSRNPPARFLAAEVARYVPWMLELAELSPEVGIAELVADPLGDGIFAVRATVENAGHLPTNVTERALASRTAVPVFATVELRDAELITGRLRSDLGHLGGTRDRASAADPGQGTRRLEWTVRVTGDRPAFVMTARSEKGGTRRRTLSLR